MSGFQSLVQRLDDILNPIVVKELRQAVRSRFMIGILMLLLLAQLCVLGITLLSQGTNFNWIASRAGGSYFFALLAVLLAVCVIFIPLYIGIRMGLERQAQNTDLLYITTLTPRAIVLGKLLSAMVLVAWIYSACTPFMLVSFLLRGISLPTILLILFYAFLATMVSTQVGVLSGSLPLPRFLKGVVYLMLLGGLFMGYGGFLGMSRSIALYGLGRAGRGNQFWAILIVAVVSSIAITGLLFVISEALLKPLSSNRMRPIRKFMSILWLATGITAIFVASLEKTFALMYIWFIGMVGLLCFSLLVNISEREYLGPRVRREIPKSRTSRFLMYPFFSGMGSGLAWTLLFFVLSIVVMTIVDGVVPTGHWKHRGDFHDVVFWGGLGVFLSFFVYSITAYLIRRHIFSQFRIGVTWIFAIVVSILCILLPFILAILSGSFSKLSENILVLTPFGLGINKVRGGTMGLMVVWAMACVPFLIGVFHRSKKFYQPYTPEPHVPAVSVQTETPVSEPVEEPPAPEVEQNEEGEEDGDSAHDLSDEG